MTTLNPNTTIDLAALVNVSLAKAISAGTLTNAIDAGVAKAIEKIADDVTGYNSPFRKQLSEAVQSVLGFAPEALGLTGYNLAITQVIKAKLDAILDDQLSNKFTKDLEELLVPAPAEIKISKLVEDFKRWAIRERATDGDRCTVRIERGSYGNSIWVHLDPKRQTGIHGCRFVILTGNGEGIYSLTDNGQDMKKAILSKSLYGFPRDLFQLLAAGTKFVFDTWGVDGDLYGYAEED